MPPVKRIDDFKLIQLVKQNEHLYDKSHAEYHDLTKKSITWQAISVALGFPVDVCRKRFRSLRDRFNKVKRVRQSDMLEDPLLPLVYKKMMFLWDHLLHRNWYDSSSGHEVVPSPERKEDVEQSPERNQEIGEQVRILEGQMASDKTDENLCDPQEEIVFIYDMTPSTVEEEEETDSEATLSDVEQHIVGTYYTEAEMTSCVQSADEQLNEIFVIPYEAGKEPGECSVQNEVVVSTDHDMSECKIQSNDPQTVHTSGKLRPLKIREINNLHDQQNHFVRTFSNMTSGYDQNSLYEQQSKRMKTTEKLLNQTNKTQQPLLKAESTFKSCNGAFCAMIKQYLDKMSSPQMLSKARVQILTILHNELYATYR